MEYHSKNRQWANLVFHWYIFWKLQERLVIYVIIYWQYYTFRNASIRRLLLVCMAPLIGLLNSFNCTIISHSILENTTNWLCLKWTNDNCQFYYQCTLYIQVSSKNGTSKHRQFLPTLSYYSKTMDKVVKCWLGFNICTCVHADSKIP